MVRIRYPDSVLIQISGVKSVIPKTRIKIGRRSMTWLTFLNEICGVQMDSKKKYFICSSGYSPNHSVEGWTADLNDPISKIVNRFSNKLRKYCVRLHRGSRPLETKTRDKKINKKFRSNDRVLSTIKPFSPLAPSPLAKPTKTVVARKFASIVPLKPNQLAKFSLINSTENMGIKANKIENTTERFPFQIYRKNLASRKENAEDNDLVVSKVAESDSLYLDNKKYVEPNLVDIFEQQVDALNESTLEKICHEIQDLRQNGMWERNLKRSPLAYCLLWEIFKD